MKVIRNNILPFGKFHAINLFGVFFVKKDVVITRRLINHENIHTAQIKELLYLFFYIWYGIEWLIKLFVYGKGAYHNISFERECYLHDSDFTYLSKRKPFAFLRYLFRH